MEQKTPNRNLPEILPEPKGSKVVVRRDPERGYKQTVKDAFKIIPTQLQILLAIEYGCREFNRALSYREILGYVEYLFGTELSESLLSTVIKTMRDRGYVEFNGIRKQALTSKGIEVVDALCL